MTDRNSMEESLSDVKARLKAQRETADQYDSQTSSGGDDKRPLIDQVNSRWLSDKSTNSSYGGYDTKDDLRELGFCDLENESSCPNTARDIISSRRFRRMIAYTIFFGLAFYYIWSRYVQPRLAEEWAYKEGFMKTENGTYGIARGGDWDKDMIRIKNLDSSFLPGGQAADPEGKRRLVFVGDIHGCKKELDELLEKIGFREETDHLVAVGDVISKGPDNLGVLDELMRLNATSVRGNHEDRILHVAKQIRADVAPIETAGSKGFKKDAAIVRELKPHHLQYLRDMPLMLHIPTLPLATGPTKKASSPITEHILVVHAGLVPGVRLEKQDPYFVMNMRSINRKTHVPSALREGKNAKPWFDIWCWYNDRISKRASMKGFKGAEYLEDDEMERDESGPWFSDLWKNFFGKKKAHKPQVVIYGHDSKQGLQIYRWSKGLDSGCVGGGKLTALVLDAYGQQELYHVGCENYRK